MSEYIEIETEPGSNPDEIILITNINLTNPPDASEQYASAAAMEEGSPLAQTLAFVEGIHKCQIAGNRMTVTRDPFVDWHIIIADVSAAVRDFFL